MGSLGLNWSCTTGNWHFSEEHSASNETQNWLRKTFITITSVSNFFHCLTTCWWTDRSILQRHLKDIFGPDPERQPCKTRTVTKRPNLLLTLAFQIWILKQVDIFPSNRLIYQPFEAMFMFNCRIVARSTNRLVPVNVLHRNLRQEKTTKPAKHITVINLKIKKDLLKMFLSKRWTLFTA